MLLSLPRRHYLQFGFLKAERVLIAARLLERKRLEFEALEREIAELEKRVKVSDNGNHRKVLIIRWLDSVFGRPDSSFCRLTINS